MMTSALGLLLFICGIGQGISQLAPTPPDANLVQSYIAGDTRCPPGWVQLNNRCFILEEAQLTFDDAELSCKDLGGNLASIRNVFEQGVANEFTKLTETSVWIGLSANSTDFMWTDGSETSLASTQLPEIFLAGCYAINPDDFVWTDTPCDAVLPYLCVRDVFQCASLCLE